MESVERKETLFVIPGLTRNPATLRSEKPLDSSFGRSDGPVAHRFKDFGLMVITLETPRLRLRMFRQADFDAYADMLADPEVMRHLPQGHPLPRPEAWRNMAAVVGHWQLRGFGPWAVVERASGEFVGRIGPFCPSGWPGLELIWTIRRQSWGQGYATEGARAALAYVFEQMGRDRIISLIRPQNAASIRVAEKIGQRLQERMDFYGGEVLVYGIRREAWLESGT